MGFLWSMKFNLTFSELLRGLGLGSSDGGELSFGDPGAPHM